MNADSIRRALPFPNWVLRVVHGALLLVAVIGLLAALQRLERPWQNDAYGFWRMWRDGDLYDLPWLAHYAFVYSPPVGQAIWPLTLLSWPHFSLLWNVAQLSALVLIVGPIWAAAIIWLLPWPSLVGYPNAVMATLENGNPMIFLALVLVAGYRWRAAWAAVVLSKVTPGIGLIWFAARGEWRGLKIALGTTAAISVISFAFAPQLWFDWFALLGDAAGANALAKEPILPVPLMARLPIAALLIAWGARTDRYWTVPIGAMLALPAIQLGGFALAVAALPFVRLPFVPRWPLGPEGQGS